MGDLTSSLPPIVGNAISKVDPETAVRVAKAKFIRRFKAIEAELAAKGKTPSEASLDEMEEISALAVKNRGS